MPKSQAGDTAAATEPAVTDGVTGAAAVALLVDLRPEHRYWGWSRLVRGPGGLGGPAGLVFAKVLGSGREGGFGLRPSGTHQGVFAVFAGEHEAEAFVSHSPVVAAYRARARELFTVKLRPVSARGRWSGRQPFATGPALAPGAPVAALTRASIRPLRAAAFWKRAPGAQESLARFDGCRVAAGLGEAPLLRQATFSVWESVEAMDRYARSGAHLQAIRDARAGDWFAEDMFVRFAPYDARGTWHGRAVDLPAAPAV